MSHTLKPADGSGVTPEQIIEQQVAQAQAAQNLSKQGAIIAQQAAENKELAAELLTLKSQLDGVRTQSNPQPTGSIDTAQNQNLQLPPEITAKLKSFEDYLEAEKRDKQLKGFSPIQETLIGLNVSEAEMPEVLEQIKVDYGVDLVANPNVNTLNAIISQIQSSNSNPQTVPQGSSAPQNYTVQQASIAEQEAYDAKVKEYITKHTDEYARSKGFVK